MSADLGASDAPGTMAFVQYALPPLESGTFNVTVTQDVVVSGAAVESFQAQQTFVVAGERYVLAPADVDSVFPPQGNQGEFSNNLAHVVLSSPTLPWQRPADPSAASPTPGEPVATWLAVLLFDQNDPPPAPQHVTIADLAATATTFFPHRVAETGEVTSTPVTVIDVPLTLVNAIAPSLADLTWTAHVRVVDPVAKAATTTPAADYSVVFGNRLPEPGNTATAHLVSMEGFGPYLPADDGTPSAAIPNGTKAVRMVSLHSWTFTALDLKQTFAGLLTQVDVSPPSLQLPYDAARASGNAAADATVDNAYGLGYVAMDHALRDGSTTVSWLRGPLLPLGVAETEPTGRTDADQWLRYDPTTGMSDISYAAAWQLGRLLALHDRAYATALYRWKLGQTRATVAALEQQVIDQQLPPAVTAKAAEATAADPRHLRMAAAVKALVAPAVRQIHDAHGTDVE